MKTAPEEQLELIQSMIAEARAGIRENGFPYLMWGYLVLLAALTHFVMLYFAPKHAPLAWTLMGLGTIIHIVWIVKHKRTARKKTYVDRSMAFIWGGMFVGIMVALSASWKIGFDTSYPIILILYGIATFASGGIIRFTPLIIGGIICWGLAVACFYVDFQYQLIAIALAMLVSFILPGHLLRARKS